MPATNTREKLIVTATSIMSAKGYNNTGIAEILNQINVPKGSFYHYFKSKDELGLAIIENYGETLRMQLEEYLKTAPGKAIVRLQNYFEMLVGYFEGNFHHCNCLLGNLAQELAIQSPEMRKAIFSHYTAIEKLIAECLKQAKKEGDIAADADEQVLAKILFSSWEGCLVRAKLEQSPASLNELLKVYFSSIVTTR